MEINSKFDKKIHLWGNRIPSEVLGASVYVIDTLNLLHAGAVDVFGEDVDPSIVIAIYDRMIRKIREDRMVTDDDSN